MVFFRRSLAEDAVDRFNHTWAVLLLLLLTVVTWLLPLSPMVQPQIFSAEVSRNTTQMTKPAVVAYRASCFNPSEFTGSHAIYVSAVCSKAFNQAILGIKPPENSSAATIHELSLNRPVGPPDSLEGRFMPNVILPGSGEEMEQEVESEASGMLTQTVSDLRYFLLVKTPLALFVFALCLKLPHVIWGLLSACFGGVNIGSTLETAKAGQSLDGESRRRLKQDLVQAVNESTSSSSPASSGLYLVFKSLMVLAAVVELIVVYKMLLPEVQTLENDLDIGIAKSRAEAAATVTPAVFDPSEYAVAPMICTVPVVQVQNVQNFAIQCVFTPDYTSVTEQQSVQEQQMQQQQQQQQDQSQLQQRVLGMYEALYNILIAFFLTLTIVNVLNLFGWVGRLVVGANRRRSGSNKDQSLDTVLLLNMARDNVGPLAEAELSDKMDWPSKRDSSNVEAVKLTTLSD